jgi:16S rRNA (uracil1498-N3)-methyltransferase
VRLTRIHVPGPVTAGADIELPEQAVEHLVRVLRLDAGAPLTLFDGRGGEYAATLIRTGKRAGARVLRHDSVERESPLDVTLLQGVARGERMDLIVQKATELGITRIIPVLAQRSVVKLDAKQRERKHEHWRNIAIAACEQCGRNRVPEVLEAQPLSAAVASLPPATTRCLLAAGAQQSLAETARRMESIALLIGPEGGLADDEHVFASANGFIACRMGPRILRTETAGLAALAILQTITGDLAS